MREVSYALMRVCRLVLALILEAGTIVCGCCGIVVTLIALFSLPGFGLGWSEDFNLMTNIVHFYPLPLGLALLAITVALLVSALAVSLPYHYETIMPGISSKTCRACDYEIVDALFCTNCNVFRPSRIATYLAHCVSKLVTIIFYIHDIMFMMIGLAPK